MKSKRVKERENLGISEGVEIILVKEFEYSIGQKRGRIEDELKINKEKGQDVERIDEWVKKKRYKGREKIFIKEGRENRKEDEKIKVKKGRIVQVSVIGGREERIKEKDEEGKRREIKKVEERKGEKEEEGKIDSSVDGRSNLR